MSLEFLFRAADQGQKNLLLVDEFRIILNKFKLGLSS
jgi:hypothetical protein